MRPRLAAVACSLLALAGGGCDPKTPPRINGGGAVKHNGPHLIVLVDTSPNGQSSQSNYEGLPDSKPSLTYTLSSQETDYHRDTDNNYIPLGPVLPDPSATVPAPAGGPYIVLVRMDKSKPSTLQKPPIVIVRTVLDPPTPGNLKHLDAPIVVITLPAEYTNCSD